MIDVRLLTARDRPTFEAWLAKDPLHQSLGITFEMVNAPDTEAFLVSDETGPLMVLRTHTAMRFAIQFDPDARMRTARASGEVLDWLNKKAVIDGANEIICRPGGNSRQFAEHLGFKDFEGKVMECSTEK